MKNLEGNKIAAAILVAGILALAIGKVADYLYHPVETSDKRGFQIEGAEEATTAEGAAPVEEEKIDVEALMAQADAKAGADVFKKCASCHLDDASGTHKIGPNLHGIANAPIAHHGNFSYSNAMKQKGGTWTHENLFAFLKKPRDFINGTKMSFAGLKDPKDIANVIKFLEAN